MVGTLPLLLKPEVIESFHLGAFFHSFTKKGKWRNQPMKCIGNTAAISVNSWVKEAGWH